MSDSTKETTQQAKKPQSEQEQKKQVQQYKAKLSRITILIEKMKLGQKIPLSLKLEDLEALQKKIINWLEIYQKTQESNAESKKEKIKSTSSAAASSSKTNNQGEQQTQRQQQYQQKKQEISKLDPDLEIAGMRICNALYQAENKWYGAVVTGQNQKQKTVQVTWVSLNSKSMLQYRDVELSKIPDAEELQIGLQCQTLSQQDGQWYPCLIVSKEEPLSTPSGDVVTFYEVQYQKYSIKKRIPSNFIRLLGSSNKAKAAIDFSNGKKNSMLVKRKKNDDDDLDQINQNSQFVIPDHLKFLPGDTQAEKENKRKKKKALKWKFKQKQIDKVQKQRKSAWSDFLNKAERKKKGYFSKQHGQSIFKSPDTITGRVGVTGSGQGMTVTVMKKAKFSETDEANEDA